MKVTIEFLKYGKTFPSMEHVFETLPRIGDTIIVNSKFWTVKAVYHYLENNVTIIETEGF